MLEIKTTGFEDYLDGSANIKTMVIGGPGAGKTRYSSFWPRPFLIDCEDGRGSIADRGVPYVRVRTSNDMLDVLEYLKGLESTPKAARKYQTIVVDTADSFQRIVKEEWVTQTKAGSFTGYDAWGYLDTKMQLLFTRLLNLDYNVIVLVHYKSKEHKDGDNTVREYVLQLQGAIADQVFNDFGLVGWMGTYWEADGGERVQKRGLTFQPTPEKPFLKDRFHVTPKWMEITFAESDYQQLFEAFMGRDDIEAIPEATVEGEVPAAAPANVAPPRDGGPVAPKPPIDPATVPLEKQTKEQLAEVAKGLGITVRGNTLKSEIITSIQAARAAIASTAPADPTPAEQPSSSASSSDAKLPASAGASTASAPQSRATTDSQSAAPSAPSPSPAPEPDPWQPPTDKQATDLVREQLGGEVISEEKTDAPPTLQPDTPSTPVAQPTSAPQGPSACADCSADLTAAWADPQKKNAMRLSFVKHRRYLCTTCYEKN